jgi:hypothetical protein
MRDISSDYVAKIGCTQLQLSQMTQHFSPRQSFVATQSTDDTQTVAQLKKSILKGINANQNMREETGDEV